MKINFFLLIIICFGFVGNLFSQPRTKDITAAIREITSEDFYDASRESSELSLKISHRSINRSEYFRDGKLYSTEEITNEVLASDRRRFLIVEKKNALITQNELIKIGNVFYCRENNGDWKQSERWCGRNTVRGFPNVEVVSKYTVEVTALNNQTVKLYQDLTTYKDKEERLYWKSKFWVSEKGLILREESSGGFVEPEKVRHKSETVYEYNPQNLRIEAPIIKTKTKTKRNPK